MGIEIGRDRFSSPRNDAICSLFLKNPGGFPEYPGVGSCELCAGLLFFASSKDRNVANKTRPPDWRLRGPKKLGFGSGYHR